MFGNALFSPLLVSSVNMICFQSVWNMLMFSTTGSGNKDSWCVPAQLLVIHRETLGSAFWQHFFAWVGCFEAFMSGDAFYWICCTFKWYRESKVSQTLLITNQYMDNMPFAPPWLLIQLISKREGTACFAIIWQSEDRDITKVYLQLYKVKKH